MPRPHLWFAGRDWDLPVLGLVLFGPLIDAPHPWATLARTYVDREEWAARRTLFLTSLLAFAIGPVLVLLPYLVRALTPLQQSDLSWGWTTWLFFVATYAQFHINKQHWGLRLPW